MATIQFTQHGSDASVNPLVMFTIRGDTLLTDKILTKDPVARESTRKALVTIGLKSRSDQHIGRNGADMLAALLFIALRQEFGDTITAEKRIDGMTLLGTTEAKELPRVNWSKP